MENPIIWQIGDLVECISDDWDDPMAPETGEIMMVDGIGMDADGVYLSFTDTVDYYAATAFRRIVHKYEPWVDWRGDLKNWGCKIA